MKDRIEATFRSSNSPDELFDAFQTAIKVKLDDLDLYKTLLANPSLSPDEIKMFTEKLSRVMPQNSFNLFMWSGNIFENLKEEPDKLEEAFAFYQRAAKSNPTDSLPLIKLLNLFNYDFDLPLNKMLLDFVTERVALTDNKRNVYAALSNLYLRRGDKVAAAKYQRLSETVVEKNRTK